MTKRFRALRTIGTLFKVLAWIVLILALIMAALAALGVFAVPLQSAVQGTEMAPVVGSALLALFSGGLVLVLGVVYFVILYAIAEGIYVIIAIEENTRLTAQAVSGRSVNTI